METLNILLCCGAGMSSGFLAQKTRKAAKKRGISGSIDARSESEVASYLDSIDIWLLGPHYASFKEEMAEQAAPHNVVVDVIPQDIYGMLDGEGLLLPTCRRIRSLDCFLRRLHKVLRGRADTSADHSRRLLTRHCRDCPMPKPDQRSLDSVPLKGRSFLLRVPDYYRRKRHTAWFR